MSREGAAGCVLVKLWVESKLGLCGEWAWKLEGTASRLGLAFGVWTVKVEKGQLQCLVGRKFSMKGKGKCLWFLLFLR